MKVKEIALLIIIVIFVSVSLQNLADWHGKKKKKVKIAEKYYEKDIKILNRRGLELVNSRNFYEALKYFDKITKMNPNHKIGWNNMGLVYSSLGNHNTAIFCFEKVVKIDSSYILAWNNLGVEFGKVKEYKKALSCFDAAIRINSAFEVAWYSKGYAFFQMKEYKNAISCFDAATTVSKNPYIRFNSFYWKGEIFWKHNEFILCKQVADSELIGFNPNHPSGYYLKGKACLSLGEYDAAISYFKDAKKIDALNLEFDIWYNYAKYIKSKIYYDKQITKKDNIETIQAIQNQLNNTENKNVGYTDYMNYFLGILYFDNKDYINSVIYLDKSINDTGDETIMKYRKELLNKIWNYKYKPNVWYWWFNSPKTLYKKVKFVVGIILIAIIVGIIFYLIGQIFQVSRSNKYNWEEVSHKIKIKYMVSILILIFIVIIYLSPMIESIRIKDFEIELQNPVSDLSTEMPPPIDDSQTEPTLYLTY